MNRRSERGSVMIIVMVILTALLSAGAVAIYVQVSDTRTTGLIRSARSSLYCAEAGLPEATRQLMLHYTDWPLVLAGDTTLGWYPVAVDLDADGTDDVVVTVVDNDDETPPTPNDPTADADLRLFLVSECMKWTDSTPREIVVLVRFDPTVHEYGDMAGGNARNDGQHE